MLEPSTFPHPRDSRNLGNGFFINLFSYAVSDVYPAIHDVLTKGVIAFIHNPRISIHHWH